MDYINQINNSVIEFFYHWEKETPDKVFLRQPKGNQWLELTYQEVGIQARKMTTYLESIGLKKGDHIGILSKNCYHWIIADLAIMMGGFVSVPYYASLPKLQLEKVLALSDLKALFVGKLEEWGDKSTVLPDDLQVIKFPHYEGNARIDVGQPWGDAIKDVAPKEGNYIPDAESLWTIKFTSGTTGTPKGVMHVHSTPVNYAKTELNTNWLGLGRVKELRLISYLPLNHVVERIGVQVCSMTVGGTISFAESIDTFVDNLRNIRPTVFMAVPRIWTKFYMGVISKFPKKRLDFLFKIPVVSSIIKRKIKEALGLQDVEIAVTGAAITPSFIKDFYESLGIRLIEAYGMTETCGGITNNPDPASPNDTVGKPMPGCDVKIDAETGEVLMKTPFIMKGYYKNQEKTDEILKDGWLYSGDRGTIDEEGYVRIIGRVKDAFKTSKGSYIVPNPMEEIFMNNDYIEQVCVAGLGIPQPIAIINLSEVGLETDQQTVEETILKSIAEVNNRGANYEKISTAVIDKTTWTEHNDFLTPTLKVKRWKLDNEYGGEYLNWHKNEQTVIWTS